jgi:hypothetical protein
MGSSTTINKASKRRKLGEILGSTPSGRTSLRRFHQPTENPFEIRFFVSSVSQAPSYNNGFSIRFPMDIYLPTGSMDPIPSLD